MILNVNNYNFKFFTSNLLYNLFFAFIVLCFITFLLQNVLKFILALINYALTKTSWRHFCNQILYFNSWHNFKAAGTSAKKCGICINCPSVLGANQKKKKGFRVGRFFISIICFVQQLKVIRFILRYLYNSCYLL